MAKKITITLTDRAPVTLDPEVWPVIAAARWSPENRDYALKVRRNDADGRMVVYAVYDTDIPSEHGRKGGALLDRVDSSDAIAAKIREVAETVGLTDRLADECIADLPAEEI